MAQRGRNPAVSMIGNRRDRYSLPRSREPEHPTSSYSLTLSSAWTGHQAIARFELQSWIFSEIGHFLIVIPQALESHTIREPFAAIVIPTSHIGGPNAKPEQERGAAAN